MCKMFKLITLKMMFALSYFVGAENLSPSYAKVATSGSNSARSSKEHEVTPKIYKALNTNLDFLTSTTKVTEITTSTVVPDTSVGRSYTYSDPYTRYPNGQRYINYHRTPTIVYPQRKLSNKHFAMDRYTPGEAVATAQFKKNKQGYTYSPPKMKASRPSGVSYIPPKDLYAFPPNTDSNYLPPRKPVLRKPISSYIPPPAGLPDLGFLGPVNPEYLPPNFQKSKPDESAAISKDSAKMPSTSVMQNGDPNNNDMLPDLSTDEVSSPEEVVMDSMKNLPQSDHNGNDEVKDSTEHDMPPEHDLPPHHDMPPDQDMPTDTMEMPPGMSDSSSDIVIPSDNFHFHSDHYGAHGVDAYPEVIFDDQDHHHHHHDHHDFHHLPEVMTTTTTMKPEPPPEPRVKKYSYFYLGRKLWYIPLYFTVWFSFYIFWLIIKSIARHKVNLPNHYTGRMMMRRETISNSDNPKSLNDINDLTNKVSRYIEDFDRKYLTTK